MGTISSKMLLLYARDRKNRTFSINLLFMCSVRGYNKMFIEKVLKINKSLLDREISWNGMQQMPKVWQL
jgi:hypothetical protein